MFCEVETPDNAAEIQRSIRKCRTTYLQHRLLAQPGQRNLISVARSRDTSLVELNSRLFIQLHFKDVPFNPKKTKQECAGSNESKLGERKEDLRFWKVTTRDTQFGFCGTARRYGRAVPCTRHLHFSFKACICCKRNFDVLVLGSHPALDSQGWPTSLLHGENPSRGQGPKLLARKRTGVYLQTPHS